MSPNMIFFHNDTTDSPGCKVNGYRTAVQAATDNHRISRKPLAFLGIWHRLIFVT
jgi:hypothetical protein